MDRYDWILLSGGSGAVGAYIVREIVQSCQTPLICLFRSTNAFDNLLSFIGEHFASRITPVFADLTDSAEIAAARDMIGPAIGSGRCLAIHCAAEVSWTKSERLVSPVNLAGTRHFADLALSTSTGKPGFVFFSTAYCDAGYEPRNAYEKSKLAAENMLANAYRDRLNLAILKCSLVVGAADDGWLPRFNGLYPMIRVVALAEVPCLIADANYKLDTVPVDFLWRQIQAASAGLTDEGDIVQLVLAAGEKALDISEVIAVTLDRANALRAEAGLVALPPISVISERQFRFLMSATTSWNLERRFAKVDAISQIMAGYVDHGSSGRDLVPRTLEEQPPDPADYLPTVVDYWIAQNRSRILTQRSPDWLDPDQEERA